MVHECPNCLFRQREGKKESKPARTLGQGASHTRSAERSRPVLGGGTDLAGAFRTKTNIAMCRVRHPFSTQILENNDPSLLWCLLNYSNGNTPESLSSNDAAMKADFMWSSRLQPVRPKTWSRIYLETRRLAHTSRQRRRTRMAIRCRGRCMRGQEARQILPNRVWQEGVCDSDERRPLPRRHPSRSA